MAERNLLYFVSDVHLGLDVMNPQAREKRFVKFLRDIPADSTRSVYLLGDIWDFWYEYRDVVPKGYVRVFLALMDLMDSGVEVCFCPGNHDIWCFSYFEEMGIRIMKQPEVVQAGGKKFCIGHGDGLGPGMYGYKLMNRLFKNRTAQKLFSLLHPWLAFRLGTGWSKNSRLAKNEEYIFRGHEDPLYKWAVSFGKRTPVDYYIFGHLHTKVDMALPDGSKLLVMKDWMSGGNYLYFDGSSVRGGIV